VSDAVAEAVKYTADDSTDGVTITQTATVTFGAGPVSASASTISAAPTTVSANGTSTSTITVTLQDSGGDVVSGATVTLSQGSGHSVITTVTGVTDATGMATFTVTDTTVEAVTYTASYSNSNGSGSLTHTVTVNFTAVATTLNLTVSPNSITAGSSVNLIAGLSVTSGGAAVAGATVNFYEASGTCSASSTLIATETTDPTGTATDPSYGSALAAGTYHICAYFVAATVNKVSYAGASSGSQTLTVANSTPTLSWKTAPPASEVYNGTFTPVAATPASGQAGYSPCTISYGVTGSCTIGRNNLVTMGSGTTSCVVTANLAACTSGGTTYGSATLTATVTATLATQTTLVLHGVPTGAINDGATFTVSTTGGSGTGAVTYSVTGACTVSGNQVTMNATGSGQTCTVTATKASDGNYASATSAPATTGQTNGDATVTITNTSQTYPGVPVTVTTAPPGLAVSVTYTGTGKTTYGPSTTAPTAVGTYSVTATVTTPGVAGSATATETISEASTELTLGLQSGTSNPTPYGTTAYFVLTLPSTCVAGSGPTGTVTLVVDGNPVAGSGGTGTLDGSCSAVVFSTATIEASSAAHEVVVQYNGDSNYPQGVSNTLDFMVSADTTAVTLAYTGSPIYVGQLETLTATITPGALSSGANGPQGTVEFFDGTTELDVAPGETLINNSGTYTATFATSSLAEGPHQIMATYVPAPGDQEFAGSSSSVTIQVNYVAPQINWTVPANIVYGTALSDVQLNATATDPNTGVTLQGPITYTPAAGYVLGAGTTNLQVSFAPTNTATYGAGPYTATVSITVTPVALTVTADNQTMVYGGTVPTLTWTITGFVNGDVPGQVTGAASCSIAGTTPYTVAGSPYTISCTQGTLAQPNYTFTTFVAGQLMVTTATPTLSLVCPEVTYDGTAHSCAGLALGTDGSTQVAGTGHTARGAKQTQAAIRRRARSPAPTPTISSARPTTRRPRR
jgi:hypothetical protein